MKQGHKRNTISCTCNSCGSEVGVRYDIDQDYYICQECINLEQEELDNKQEEDEYPLDLTYSEFKKELNK